MNRLIVLLVLAALGACDSDDDAVAVVEVSGDTGTCSESNTTWSGDAPADAAVPGLVLDRTITCPRMTMSDERVSGAMTGEYRCEFSLEDDVTIGDCVGDNTISNDVGAWEEKGWSFTITLPTGEPWVVVEEGTKEGTGGYKGLLFAYRTGGGPDYPWPITGTIEPAD